MARTRIVSYLTVTVFTATFGLQIQNFTRNFGSETVKVSDMLEGKKELDLELIRVKVVEVKK